MPRGSATLKPYCHVHHRDCALRRTDMCRAGSHCAARSIFGLAKMFGDTGKSKFLCIWIAARRKLEEWVIILENVVRYGSEEIRMLLETCTMRRQRRSRARRQWGAATSTPSSRPTAVKATASASLPSAVGRTSRRQASSCSASRSRSVCGMRLCKLWDS